MAETTLTGATAASYVQAWMRAAAYGAGVNAAKLRRDATASRTCRKASVRLSLACRRFRRAPARTPGRTPPQGVRLARARCVRRTARAPSPGRPGTPLAG